MSVGPSGSGAFDALIQGLPPDLRAQAVAGLAGGGQDKPKDKVPWLNFGYGRAADIKPKPGEKLSPNQADRRAAMLAEAGIEPATTAPAVDEWANYQNPEADIPATDPETAAGAENRGQGPEVLRDVDEVMREPRNWSAATLADVARQMANVGLIDIDNWSLGDVLKVWEDLVGHAVEHYKARPSDLLTPLDMLDIVYGNGEGSNASEKKIDPVEVLQKSTRISTNLQARNTLTGVLAQKLGRRPTAIEIDDFQAALNDAQAANPTITKGTTYFEKGRASHTTSETSGGLDDDAFADEYTDWRDPDSEYGRYQAATTYYNELMRAIRGPGGA